MILIHDATTPGYWGGVPYIYIYMYMNFSNDTTHPTDKTQSQTNSGGWGQRPGGGRPPDMRVARTCALIRAVHRIRFFVVLENVKF